MSQQVYAIGVGLHPATRKETRFRLEELVFRTARQALESAQISRRQLDNLVIGACDELDGRPISSMLMAAPAGGYLRDEIKVTDSGATALCLAYARIRSGEFQAAMVSSWCKSSKTDADAVFRLRGDPFFMRPLGMDNVTADALFAQAVAAELGITDAEVATRIERRSRQATANPRGLQAPVRTAGEIAKSPYRATPLREGHVPELSDGAVSIVLCSQAFLDANPQVKPLARITGVGWSSDSYRLDATRLRSMKSARAAWAMAMNQAGITEASALDVIELEAPTGWHEAAYVRAFGIEDDAAVSPSGGQYAQNPLFCSGMVNAAEAILQVAGQAGAVQVPAARRSAAHSCNGYAQQGNVVAIFEAVEAGI
ncbi:hypothetical protein M9978_06350 [Sphingomonas sp. MG17]|uniref:Acetyl-CoA acetyltransferase n=1 Tax=Sphingomonas tagetis TaxID=2949092 RepID=A0A9X2KL47_9SPHN|nr:hypothetical protein [Sphingomonas tagetis]